MTEYEYKVEASERYSAERREYTPAFEVQHVTTRHGAVSRTEVLATYTNRAAAELVVSALRAAQTDLTSPRTWPA